MYNKDVLRIPSDESDMWDLLWEQFEYVRHILYELPVEDKEGALTNVFHDRGDGKINRGRMAVIRYRDTGDELDQRDHYLDLGRELLPYVHQALDEKKLTPEFVQQWGKVMFCHGYIASYVFDDTDDLTNVRKGKLGNRDSQRKWLAHIIVPLRNSGMIREEAEKIAAMKVEDALLDEQLRGGFSLEWFKPMLTGGYLAATYDNKHFSMKRMRELIKEPTDDIPPIPKIP